MQQVVSFADESAFDCPRGAPLGPKCMQAFDLKLKEPAAEMQCAPSFFGRHPEIVVALVLWLASNAFVAVFAKLARWETGAHYYRMSDLCRWDCSWYSSVAEAGYDNSPQRGTGDKANWPFHPLFPAVAYSLHHGLKLPLSTSLVAASKLALLLAIYGFLLLVSGLTETTVDRFRAGSLVALNPYLIYGHAGYAEPLYFALLALAFYLVEQKKWVAAGATAALVSATRMVGFLFSISYAVVWLKDVKWRSVLRSDNLNKVIGLFLCPLGTAVFMLYLYRHTGDALAQVHSQAGWGKSPGNPFIVLWDCLNGHYWPRVWGVMAVVALAAAVWLFKLRKPELGTYLLLVILMSLSGGFWAMARYVWWQPPFLYAVYCGLKRYPALWVLYVGFAAGMASFMIIGWFSGHNFVV